MSLSLRVLLKHEFGVDQSGAAKLGRTTLHFESELGVAKNSGQIGHPQTVFVYLANIESRCPWHGFLEFPLASLPAHWNFRMAVFGRQLDFDLAPLARIASCLGFNLVESVEDSRLVLKLACLKVGRPGPQIW